MTQNRIPEIGDRLKIHIHKRIGGGYHLAEVASIEEEDKLLYMRCDVIRTFTDNKIQPPTQDTLCIPAYVQEMWEFY